MRPWAAAAVLGGGFIQWSPMPSFYARLRLFETRSQGSIVRWVVGFAAHGYESAKSASTAWPCCEGGVGQNLTVLYAL